MGKRFNPKAFAWETRRQEFQSAMIAIIYREFAII